jgi:hypothetical protein
VKKAIPGSPGWPPGVSNYQVVTAAAQDTTAWSEAVAHCPAGLTAIGGGAEIAGALAAAVLFRSKPIPNGIGGYDWDAVAVNQNVDSGQTFHVNAFAICATVG